MTKVLVCGGRDYNNKKFLYKTLDDFHKNHTITLIIQGGARGADTLAYHWALSQKIPSRTFSANWKKYGPQAGPIRNQEMLREAKPDLIIAFPGGEGTQDMINRGNKAAIPVYVIKE